MVSAIRERQGSAPTDELLKLYWNRADVKRELKALRRERFELLDKLKEQEGAILRAQEQLWRVFKPIGGRWRGIAHVPNGNLRLRGEYASLDARRQFQIDLTALWDAAPPALAQQCICGDIMAGIRSPSDCRLFGRDCLPEGTCRIWHQYGTRSDLAHAVGIRAGVATDA